MENLTPLQATKCQLLGITLVYNTMMGVYVVRRHDKDQWLRVAPTNGIDWRTSPNKAIFKSADDAIETAAKYMNEPFDVWWY